MTQLPLKPNKALYTHGYLVACTFWTERRTRMWINVNQRTCLWDICIDQCILIWTSHPLFGPRLAAPALGSWVARCSTLSKSCTTKPWRLSWLWMPNMGRKSKELLYRAHKLLVATKRFLCCHEVIGYSMTFSWITMMLKLSRLDLAMCR